MSTDDRSEAETVDARMNPLLAWGEIPDFAAITVDHVVPAVRFTLARAAADLDALEAEAGRLPIAEIVGRSAHGHSVAGRSAVARSERIRMQEGIDPRMRPRNRTLPCSVRIAGASRSIDRESTAGDRRAAERT